MPRPKKTPLPTVDLAAVEAVLKRHRTTGHVFSPSSVTSGKRAGVSCFVWVSGKCYSETLDLTGNVHNELAALPHAFNVHINID